MSRDNVQDTSDLLSVPPGGSVWVVAHTRPRCEKKLVLFCDQNDIASYLPLRTRVHRYGRRERAFSAPLFPGYVFCIVTTKQQSYVRQNRYVANLLEVGDQAKLVAQLRQIRTALVAGASVEVMPYLETGKRVKVVGGAFRGLEGIVVRSKGKARVVVNVDMIEQSVAVEVDVAFLGPA